MVGMLERIPGNDACSDPDCNQDGHGDLPPLVEQVFDHPHSLVPGGHVVGAVRPISDDEPGLVVEWDTPRRVADPVDLVTDGDPAVPDSTAPGVMTEVTPIASSPRRPAGRNSEGHELALTCVRAPARLDPEIPLVDPAAPGPTFARVRRSEAVPRPRAVQAGIRDRVRRPEVGVPLGIRSTLAGNPTSRVGGAGG